MVYVPPYFRNPPVYNKVVRSHTDIININMGGGCGGHAHHCHGGGGGWNRGLGAMFGLGILTSFINSLFNKGSSQPVVMQQPTVMMPMPQSMMYNNYGIGYNAGLYTPGSAGMMNNGYNAGFNQGLYGTGGGINQLGYMQNQYGQLQQAMNNKNNELNIMIKDLNNDYSFTFGENEEVPQLAANGQQYSYKGKTFDTVTDLRNFIEKQEGLGCQPNSPSGQQNPTIVEEQAIHLNTNDESVQANDEETHNTPEQSSVQSSVQESDAAPQAEDANSEALTSTHTHPGKHDVITQEQSEKMFAELRTVFGNIPDGVELNPDGTFNYGKYQNININALKYAVNAQKNYETKSESEVTYNNFLNNDKGRMYSDGQLSITKQQISNTETLGAFLLRNNPDTYIELGKISSADFEKTFGNMFEDNIKNAKKDITENEFISYHKDYENNTKNGILRRDKERQKYETVDITSADEAHLKNLFYAMSNGSGKVSKAEYVKFMTDLFAQHSGKLTRAQLDDFCVNWLNKSNN